MEEQFDLEEVVARKTLVEVEEQTNLMVEEAVEGPLLIEVLKEEQEYGDSYSHLP